MKDAGKKQEAILSIRRVLRYTSCSPFLYLILTTKANSNIANATKMVHVSSQRSIKEKLSETGVFCLAAPEMLISMRRVVIRRDILPGSKLGGIKKLERKSE